jgi:hypothetical protein
MGVIGETMSNNVATAPSDENADNNAASTDTSENTVETPQETQQHISGDEVVYTDHAGMKHDGFLEHVFAHGSKLLAHLRLSHNNSRIEAVEHDAQGSVHTWQAK